MQTKQNVHANNRAEDMEISQTSRKETDEGNLPYNYRPLCTEKAPLHNG